MATIAAPTYSDQRLVLHGVSWETYLDLSEARSEGVVRLSYHHGVLEIMTLSHLHERLSRFLHRFVVEITLELGLELASVGSTTMRAPRADIGAEADESYYIRHEEAIRDREEFDPEVDPPPDLVVEVDLSSPSSRRMLVYAELGIPEVWRYDGERLVFASLGNDGQYHSIEHSVSFPALRCGDLEPFIKRHGTKGENASAQEFRQWLQQSLAAEK